MKSYIPIILSGFLLSACGGGGGSDSDEDSVSLPGRAITANEFASLLTSGRYRYDISLETDYTDSFVNNSTTYSISFSGDAGVRGVLTVIINNPSSAISNSCELEGPETIDPREFGIEDDDLNIANCEIFYSQISATEFGIAQVCPDLLTGVDIVSAGSIKRISTDTSFDNGSLAIINSAGTTVDSNTANSEVCGYIAKVDTETTINPPLGIVSGFDVNQTDLTLVAPYLGGDLIQANISLARANLTAGTYTIADLPTDGTSANIAEMSFASAYFGGTPSNPVFAFANNGGTVTINSVSADAVSGSFDVTLDTGDSVTGTFTINLN